MLVTDPDVRFVSRSRRANRGLFWRTNKVSNDTTSAWGLISSLAEAADEASFVLHSSLLGSLRRKARNSASHASPTAATLLIERGVDLHFIQELLTPWTIEVDTHNSDEKLNSELEADYFVILRAGTGDGCTVIIR